MKPISNIFAAVIFSVSFVFLVGVTVPSTQAQVAHVCSCGSPKCGGCLQGKLFPVKKLTSALKPKKNCSCEACQASSASSQPVVTSDVLISTQMLPEVIVQPQGFVQSPACACGQKPCRCKLRSKLPRTRSCPECDCDFCELKVSKSKEKKTRYEVKQKEVCIPAVTLPWKKNCPPKRSKVRVVNVLSKKTYECPTCKYEWKVYEPEVPKAPEAKSSKGIFGKEESANSDSEPVEEVAPIEPTAPKMNVPEPPNAKDLDLDTVPRPPVEKDA